MTHVGSGLGLVGGRVSAGFDGFRFWVRRVLWFHRKTSLRSDPHGFLGHTGSLSLGDLPLWLSLTVSLSPSVGFSLSRVSQS